MPPRLPIASCIHHRSFSTTRCLRAIGPESPKWLPVPPPVQANPERRPPIKGTLPVPRDPFRRDNKHAYKASAEYLAAVTKEPSSTLQPRGPEAERLAWKARMAEARRKNLREGMMELAQRKAKRIETRQAKSKRKLQERQERLDTPERDDEKFTRPTLPPEITALLSERGPPRPTRTPEYIAWARKRYERKLQAKADERQEQLHVLHTHARNFIVDEKQLEEAIEREFGQDDKPRTFGPEGSGASIWDVGIPLGVKEMIERNEGTEEVEQMRLRRLAEELTGGRA